MEIFIFYMVTLTRRLLSQKFSIFSYKLEIDIHHLESHHLKFFLELFDIILSLLGILGEINRKQKN